MFHAFSQSTNGEEKNSQIESTNICYVIIFNYIKRIDKIISPIFTIINGEK